MSDASRPTILTVDDNPATLKILGRFLSDAGYEVVTASGGREALDILQTTRPDLILLDIMMPDITGYDVCSTLQTRQELALVPVIFVSALGDEQHKSRAFSVGGADFVEKPFRRDDLLAKVARHLKARESWGAFREEKPKPPAERASRFAAFRDSLFDRAGLAAERRKDLSSIGPVELYALAPALKMSYRDVARAVADFSGMKYRDAIADPDIDLGRLPQQFCRANLVVPVHGGFVVTNPFQLEVIETLRAMGPGEIEVTEPDTVLQFFPKGSTVRRVARPAPSTPAARPAPTPKRPSAPSLSAAGDHPVLSLAEDLLKRAVRDRASDLHIEPKEGQTVIRFRVDGELHEAQAVPHDLAMMLISHFKAHGGMDIAERRRPQDGASEVNVDGRRFKLRLATSSTPAGESLNIRVLEPSAKPKPLTELGMTDDQVRTMEGFAERSQGLVLVVGPTGSGKSTTLYSLLSRMNLKARSLISVEDPVEYVLTDAKQQQVNEKAGLTFEALLKSAMRQDPDILFLGEVRDPFSAKAALDFASSGHLTLTSLHTFNATTAVFRLERLGISRGAVADATLGVVAQKLLRKLCAKCKKTRPITAEERAALSRFLPAVPAEVCDAVGCAACRDTGYFGRVGIYEILRFDPEIADLVRRDASISEIRLRARARGAYLISAHAAEKARLGVCSIDEVRRDVLAEEVTEEPSLAASAPRAVTGPASILVVDDDDDARVLLERMLTDAGYAVETAVDGIDALMRMAGRAYDLTVADIAMPNLDGLRMLEVMVQKRIATPVIFVTGQEGTEMEGRGFELGAADFIRKPIYKNVFLPRVRNALRKGRGEGA